MFTRGLSKVALVRIKQLKPPKLGALHGPHAVKAPHANIDPISTRDAAGASTKMPFSQPIHQFADPHKPRMALKALSRVRRA